VRVTGSSWFSAYAEGPPFDWLDIEYPQVASNAIRVYAGDQPIRSRASASYFLRWIDELERMANASQDWRSSHERQHVLNQFQQARAVYRRLGAEAQP
jgi:hypothetical protein